MNGLSRTICIYGVFILGVLFPQMASLSFIIQYAVMVMLFFSFLTMPLAGNPVKPAHFWVLLANLALGFIPYFALKGISQDYALIAFITGITPTAIAAPVIISLIHKDVSFAATSVLITNLGIAFIIPFTLPYMVGASMEISVSGIVLNVLTVMLIPFALAFLLRIGYPRGAAVIKRLSPLSFYIWIILIWIAVAKTTVYLKSQDEASLTQLAVAALISFSLCLAGFLLGALLGGKQFRRETSQSLGQKNVMFSIWLSLTYLNPFIAMGPTFYILFHHMYNGWIILKYGDKKK